MTKRSRALSERREHVHQTARQRSVSSGLSWRKSDRWVTCWLQSRISHFFSAARCRMVRAAARNRRMMALRPGHLPGKNAAASSAEKASSRVSMAGSLFGGAVEWSGWMLTVASGIACKGVSNDAMASSARWCRAADACDCWDESYSAISS
eukprot:jgi/Mesvir1/24514/Mv25993-RA.1